MGWAALRSKWVKLPPVSEFVNQTLRMLRKGSEALGSTLVIFTNKNNSRLQINSRPGMKSLWHGS
ncbi:unnamed protein product [Prunus armeniaca]